MTAKKDQNSNTMMPLKSAEDMFASTMRQVLLGLAVATFTTAPLWAQSSVAGSSNGGRKLQVVGLTSDQRLIKFDEFSPGRSSNVGTVSGFTGGDTALVGIDYRVQNGLLYGVGNAGGVYVFSKGDAVATLVNRLTVPLSGTSFGVDFNPAADRLRIISDNGQNLRHNVNSGGVTIADGTLFYPAPPATPTPAPGLTGAAYTNNDLNPSTATALFDLDATLDQVVIQSPANSGQLAATGKLTVDTTSAVGFDIHSTLLGGVTVDVQALASLTPAGGTVPSLYAVNLATGKATLRGVFKPSDRVIDIAIPLNQRSAT